MSIGLALRLGAIVGAAILLGLLYRAGYRAGANAVEVRQATVAKRIAAAAEKTRNRIDTLSGDLAAARRDQDTTMRTIYRDSIRIIDRPVYRNLCVDADGVGLLDRARASANAGATGGAADAAAVASYVPAQRGRDAERAAVPDRQP